MANLESLLLVVMGTIGAMIGIFEIVYIAKTKQVVNN
jgi:predicted nucleic acid-binding protein